VFSNLNSGDSWIDAYVGSEDIELTLSLVDGMFLRSFI